ncbi:MAG: substrate-binding domain-containing protein, partial [Rhodothermales bacterium]
LHAPVVLIGTRHPEFDSLYWDDAAGGRAAIEHLLELGHRRIAVITSHTPSKAQDERVKGAREAMVKGGVDSQLIFSGHTEKHAGFSEEAGYEAMETILHQQPPVTAVFAMSDVQALGACKAVKDSGKRVPEDVAVVGYDDIKSSYYIGLSTVDQRMHWVGEEATEQLLKQMHDEANEAPISRLIVPELVARGSSVKQ